MKKLTAFLSIASLCFLMLSCAASHRILPFSHAQKDRLGAVIEITEISRSTTQFPENDGEITAPTYFEVVAISTTAAHSETTSKPTPTEPPKEFYTVKFVDIDGYSAISIQSVEEGTNAIEPPMPQKRDDMVFLGWDKDFTNVYGSMIVKAIYQKEWLTVRFFDINGKLLDTQQILYGDSAKPPQIYPPSGYKFKGWSNSYKNVLNDVDIYATYEPINERKFTELGSAYKFLTVTKNTNNVSNYFRKELAGVCTIQGEDYAGNIIYGNFSDMIDISNFGFTTFEGKVGLKEQPGNINNDEYALIIYIYLDGKLAYHDYISKTNSYKEFVLSLEDVNTITVHLESYKNGAPCSGSSEFIGGIIDAVLYEN